MSTTTALPLAGKSALVTGAARSIGAEIALTLARRDAKVVVHYEAIPERGQTNPLVEKNLF